MCLCVLLEDASRRVLEVAVLPTGHVVDLTAVLVRAVRDLCLPAVLHQDNGTTHPGGRRRAALRQVRSHDSDARGRTGGACGSLRRSDAEVLGSLGSTPRPSEGNP